MLPARVALAGDTGIGDSLPRPRPTFAARSNLSVVAVAFTFALGGAMLAAVFNRASEIPVLAVVIGGALALVFAVPISVGLGFSPSMQPIRDLAQGAERVAAGDYSQRLSVVQDDDLGALAASFNRMQAGLAERQRLQAAFGTYVDPALAARLLEQGDDVFTGERREVTVMFVDIRDFTPFAEANTAEDTVARLNALFDIVVPAVVDAGGHVNKFLGDGALAVFGAPNDLADHPDAAITAAVLVHRLVAERFGGELRIGIGVNTGTVIAGTIGGAGKLEFTLIGDTAIGLVHLVVDDIRRADHHRADHDRVDADRVVTEHVVVAPLHAGPQIAVAGGVGLADEHVGELVADQGLVQSFESISRNAEGTGETSRDERCYPGLDARGDPVGARSGASSAVWTRAATLHADCLMA